jgi:hypothetical protein
MNWSLLQYASCVALGYATCYTKENTDIVFSKTIDLYVDAKHMINNTLKPWIKDKNEEPESFWSYLKTTINNRGTSKYHTTYKKEDNTYQLYHDNPEPQLLTTPRLSDLSIVSIESSESSLTSAETHLIRLILSQWAGYSGDFHGNVPKLSELFDISDVVTLKKITKIIVNTNMFTETIIE